jgi:zinc transporter 9
MGHGSKGAVYSAILANGVLTVVKFGAFSVSGSAALLSEGIHSFADCSNQSLLALGLRRSERPADEDHPYGYSRELFIWALISAVGIFFLGCGLSVYHGVNAMLHPHPLENSTLSIGVLLFSAAVEAVPLFMAAKAVRQSAKETGLTFLGYIREGPDPMAVAVLLEDIAAEVGVVIALACLFTARVTGDPRWDALASILIGLLLGAVAIFLIRRNKTMLTGQSMQPRQRSIVSQILAEDPVVESFQDVKATVLGPDRFRFKAEVDFDGRAVARRYLAGLQPTERSAFLETLRDEAGQQAALEEFGEHLVDALAKEIDRIEEKMREQIPELQHVDLEAD